MTYIPKRVYFEKRALNYPLGEKLYNFFNKNEDVEVIMMKGNRVTGIPKETPRQFYVEGKNSIAVRVWKGSKFQGCKPSAHYQMPLVSGCSGKCEYCYLNTRFGDKPYITIYANIEDVLNRAKEYIEERKPDVTYFEASATSDPVPFEPYTGSLATAVEFFGKKELGRLRFVSKFTEIDSLLDIEHKGHTTIRFSINSHKVINKYEHATAKLDERIDASKKVYDAGYPIGFIIGPVILYEGWKDDYLKMLKNIKKKLGSTADRPIRFEVISHRFTSTAKSKILAVFPETTLPMNEEERKFKYGQFGYGKYVYKKEQLKKMEEFFVENLNELFPNSEIDYVI
ncbi:spore photoproduct lyase [Caldisalinibacter kiritimatiensis]|uniref:Spore photoproduct lyase n=1 Tax=Caldisalinibacter kiritimatiensis TaxID=1304284 RepID=R1CSD1_9FIRM|nr:spore photoproduct lyase [Caldisalinibacter kiritimatiensis]EOD01561.1 Spore photoproduct lyase [Caldisalinibacter kiritimatiensis]